MPVGGRFHDGLSSFETGTLSLWRAADHAAAFAYSEGPHRQAIGAGRDGGWFRESWFGRFGVSGAVGAWPGLDPASVRGVSGPSREG